MKKTKILVIMGGPSAEHEISVISGREVVASLDPKKFLVSPVIVSKDGKRWQITDRESVLNLPDPIKLKGSKTDVSVVPVSTGQSAADIAGTARPDVVFIAMHGSFGEDGRVQALIETTGVPYTGSGVLASAIGMDKAMFRKVMKSEKLPIPKYFVCGASFDIGLIIKTLGKFPYFVKPVSQGSSVGSAIVKNIKELKPAIESALKYDERVLIDEYIKGTEVTCGVLGNTNPKALPVTEIRPLKNAFFDYESKYTESGAKEITPAEISKTLTKKIQDLSIRVFKAIGCRGFGRVDFIIKNGHTPVILEINTIPGLTPMSLMPQSALAAGINYDKLIEKIVDLAVKRNV